MAMSKECLRISVEACRGGVISRDGVGLIEKRDVELGPLVILLLLTKGLS